MPSNTVEYWVMSARIFCILIITNSNLKYCMLSGVWYDYLWQTCSSSAYILALFCFRMVVHKSWWRKKTKGQYNMKSYLVEWLTYCTLMSKVMSCIIDSLCRILCPEMSLNQDLVFHLLLILIRKWIISTEIQLSA